MGICAFNSYLIVSKTAGLIKMEYKGLLNVLNNIHQYMNHPTEVLTALAHCITKQDAMFHFTLPNYKHPEGLPDALAVRLALLE